MHQARHKFLRKVDILHINGIRKEWSNLLIAKSGYAATYPCDEECEPTMLLGKTDKRIYIGLDGFHTTLDGRDSVCLTMKTHAFAPYSAKPIVCQPCSTATMCASQITAKLEYLILLQFRNPIGGVCSVVHKFLVQSYRFHFTISLIPLALLWGVDRVIFADDTACIEVIGKGKDNVGKFKSLLQFLALRTEQSLALHSLISINGTHDVATHGTGGVAVTIMFDGCNEGFLYTAHMTHSTVESDSPCLFARSSLAEHTDVICIALVVGGKRHSHTGEVGKLMLICLIISFVDAIKRIDGFKGDVCHVCLYLVLFHPYHTIYQVCQHG